MSLTTNIDRKILRTLKQYIPSVEVYLVGGVVRDFFLKKPASDRDYVIVGMTLKEIASALSSIGTVNEVGKSFGIVTATIDGEKYDFALPRKEVSTGEKHTDFIVETAGVSLLEDLKRRDFTMNSIAYNIETDVFIDPNNGIVDIKNNTIRFVGLAIDRFREDPLRLLRMVQFRHRFGFSFCFDGSITEQEVSLINSVSKERIYEEYKKAFIKGPPSLDKLIGGISSEVFDSLFGVNNPGEILMDYTASLTNEVIESWNSYSDEFKINAQLIRLFWNKGKYENMKMPNKQMELLETYKRLELLKNTGKLICPRSFQNKTLLLEIMEIAKRFSWSIYFTVEKVVSNPMCLKELEVTGEDFMQMEIQPVKIGEMVNTIIHLIFEGKLRNKREELISFINTNKG